MKYKPGQRVTLSGTIVGTAEFYDHEFGHSATVTVDLAGPTKPEIISVDDSCVRLVEPVDLNRPPKPAADDPEAEDGTVPKLSAGRVTPDVIYAALLRLGYLDESQIPCLFRWAARDIVRKMEELEQMEEP